MIISLEVHRQKQQRRGQIDGFNPLSRRTSSWGSGCPSYVASSSSASSRAVEWQDSQETLQVRSSEGL